MDNSCLTLTKLSMFSKLLFFACIALLFSSCSVDCDSCGLELNSKRKKLGIVLIKESWEKLETDVNRCYWSTGKKIGHSQKCVVVNSSGMPIREYDYYTLNQMSYLDPDNSVKENVRIVLEYNYESNTWSTMQEGSVSDNPIYEIQPEAIYYDMDYLHYNHGVPWSDLPKVDMSVFPLKRHAPEKDSLNN